MEEADTLADRVLIMSEGTILSEGTTQELKIEHGAGYLLKLMCQPDLDVDKLLDIVRKFIPAARVKVYIANDLPQTRNFIVILA